MYWNDLYVILAENLSLTNTDPPRADLYFNNCLSAIATIRSNDDGSLITRTFFKEIYKVYIDWVSDLTLYKVYIKILARKINQFTVDNINLYGNDLTDFVNNLNWTDGCIPFQWKEWADDAYFNTDGWNSCILSEDNPSENIS